MNKELLYQMLNELEEKGESQYAINKIKNAIESGDYQLALEEINELKNEENPSDFEEDIEENDLEDDKDEISNNNLEILEVEEFEYEKDDRFPTALENEELEEAYIGILLNDVKAISRYYILFEDNYFINKNLLNIYKSVLFTEGEAYASETAKRGYSFAKESQETYEQKEMLKEKYANSNYNFEKIYNDIYKLFTIRRYYLEVPVKTIQDKIIEIVNYDLYDKMSIEEVKAAVDQVTVTQKFKEAVLTNDLSGFLSKGDNNLVNGLELPFPILSEVFKGIRKGETMSFSMPSNAGKSRFTVNLATQLAFVHKKKVLIISNEMSEEKMKLCLITTIINNPTIQKLHGYKIKKSEGELLEFKFRPDDTKNVEIDEDGFVVQKPNETKANFVKRLTEISSEFNQIMSAVKWATKQIQNSIYFINITDHTNDELKKVITNYYYKEKIEYMFYDTMKTDTENIGNGEELKKTATILSNLAQDFGIYICSTLQLTETTTLPINLSIADLAVSRTVKEVLDTLCLIKQIPKENYADYEYSLTENADKCFNIKLTDDINDRYYACVVDKNRAGAKPKVLFKLNLAYNEWNELGYLRLKSK